MPIQAIEPRRLYRQIADHIADLIRRGEFAPGSRLSSDRELAQKLRVSRPSVREALIALEIEGWVEVRIGSGIYVKAQLPATNASPPLADPGPFEILAARAFIEPEMAALAARNATASDIARISETLDMMTAEIRETNSGLDADTLFHIRIAEATGNSAFAAVVKTLWDFRKGALYRKMDNYFDPPTRHMAAVKEHRRVVQAIKRGDTEAAREAMTQHLDAYRANLETSWNLANAPAPAVIGRKPVKQTGSV